MVGLGSLRGRRPSWRHSPAHQTADAAPGGSAAGTWRGAGRWL